MRAIAPFDKPLRPPLPVEAGVEGLTAEGLGALVVIALGLCSQNFVYQAS